MGNLNTVDVRTSGGSTINKLNLHAQSNQLQFSNDFLIKKTTQGTHISLKPSVKQNADGMKYQSNLDPTRSYATADEVRVLSGSNQWSVNGTAFTASVGTFVCVVPVPAFGYVSSNQNEMRQSGVNYLPCLPESASLANPWATGTSAGGRFWEQVGGMTAATSGSQISKYTISSQTGQAEVYGNYFVGISSTGTHQRIAKNFKLRCSITGSSIDGNTWNYTYASGSGLGSVYRTATNPASGYSEYQRVSPRYLTGDEIWAATVSNSDLGGITGGSDSVGTGSSAITLVDANFDGRAWTAQVDQTNP